MKNSPDKSQSPNRRSGLRFHCAMLRFQAGEILSKLGQALKVAPIALPIAALPVAAVVAPAGCGDDPIPAAEPEEDGPLDFSVDIIGSTCEAECLKKAQEHGSPVPYTCLEAFDEDGKPAKATEPVDDGTGWCTEAGDNNDGHHTVSFSDSTCNDACEAWARERNLPDLYVCVDAQNDQGMPIGSDTWVGTDEEERAAGKEEEVGTGHCEKYKPPVTPPENTCDMRRVAETDTTGVALCSAQKPSPLDCRWAEVGSKNGTESGQAFGCEKPMQAGDIAHCKEKGIDCPPVAL